MSLLSSFLVDFSIFSHMGPLLTQNIVYCISVVETSQASLKFSPFHVLTWEFCTDGMILYSLLLEQLL